MAPDTDRRAQDRDSTRSEVRLEGRGGSDWLSAAFSGAHSAGCSASAPGTEGGVPACPDPPLSAWPAGSGTSFQPHHLRRQQPRPGRCRLPPGGRPVSPLASRVTRTARCRQDPGQVAPAASPCASRNSPAATGTRRLSPGGLFHQPRTPPLPPAWPPASQSLHLCAAPLLAFRALSPPWRGRLWPPPRPRHGLCGALRFLPAGARCVCHRSEVRSLGTEPATQHSPRAAGAEGGVPCPFSGARALAEKRLYVYACGRLAVSVTWG